MNYRVELRLELGPQAGAIHSAVEMDNGVYISSEVRGEVVTAQAESATLPGLLRTVDDFISCLQVAERTVRSSSPP